MPSYSDIKLRDVLDAFTANSPAPGGGSAAALTGATGASLLIMAASVTTSQTRESAHSAELAAAANRLRSLQHTLIELIDRDAATYSSVIAARRMPAADEETAVRQHDAYESAMRAATDAPLDTMRACRRALQEAPHVAAHCARSTAADVGVAIELLQAALRAAGITVDANLASLRDPLTVDQLRAERRQLETDGTADAERALGCLAPTVRERP